MIFQPFLQPFLHVLTSLAFQPATPAPQPAAAPQPVTAPAPTPIGGFKDAADLLGALETADEGLDQFQALIRYDRMLDLEGETQVRKGALFFDRAKAAGKPVRRFAVRFDSFQVGTAVRNEQRLHVFDGTWYADKMPEEKKINRKEVVGPGQSFDPMKLGEGPMPIPIGQKKDDILSRYTAELLPANDGLGASDATLKTFLEGTVQVRLVPKAGAAPGGDAFEEIRLWYRGKRPEQMSASDKPSERLLPRAARTVSVNKDVSIVQLIDIRVNTDATIEASIMDTSAPEGWQVTEAKIPVAAPVATPVVPPVAPAESTSKDTAPAEEKKDAPK